MSKKKYPYTDKTINDGKLYQKIGKRYYPISDLHAYEGLRQGAWLVTVDDGCTSIRRSVEPDNIAVEAAFKYAADRLTKIIAKYSEERPKTTPLTPLEQKAVKAYYDVMGKEKILYFEYPALATMAEEIIAEVRKMSNI
jgi:hypothetical protein